MFSPLRQGPQIVARSATPLRVAGASHWHASLIPLSRRDPVLGHYGAHLVLRWQTARLAACVLVASSSLPNAISAGCCDPMSNTA